jgi:hypothetical protein
VEFTLTYRGPLRANRGPKEKHELRRHFHSQLRTLWDQVPLNAYRDFIAWPAKPAKPSVIEECHGIRFAPLVSAKIKFAAALDLLLLRPEPPGTLFSQAGDLDNRVKTLLDALKVPHEPQALPAGATAEAGEDPFFCLLQDDSLITGLVIRTDRLLEPIADPAEVLLLLRVNTVVVQSLMSTLAFR